MNLKGLVTVTTQGQLFISKFPPTTTQAAFSHHFPMLSLSQHNQLSLPALTSLQSGPLHLFILSSFLELSFSWSCSLCNFTKTTANCLNNYFIFKKVF